MIALTTDFKNSKIGPGDSKHKAPPPPRRQAEAGCCSVIQGEWSITMVATPVIESNHLKIKR